MYKSFINVLSKLYCDQDRYTHMWVIEELPLLKMSTNISGHPRIYRDIKYCICKITSSNNILQFRTISGNISQIWPISYNIGQYGGNIEQNLTAVHVCTRHLSMLSASKYFQTLLWTRQIYTHASYRGTSSPKNVD